ncbi:MAG: hypothetical protein ACLRQ0_09520 [Monoglobales bacterium]
MKFTTSGTIDVAVYFCNDLTAVLLEDAICIPRTSSNQESYAGKANNFYISTTKTLYAADAFASYYSSYFFGIAMYKKSGNSTEHNPIQLVQGGTASENASYPNNNLGNYGLQYAMSFKLRNNHDKRVKFRGYIISNSASHCCGIQSGGIAKGKFIEPNAGGYNRWQFYESGYINKDSYVDIDFQYMHLSKESAPGIIQFEVAEA